MRKSLFLGQCSAATRADILSIRHPLIEDRKLLAEFPHSFARSPPCAAGSAFFALSEPLPPTIGAATRASRHIHHNFRRPPSQESLQSVGKHGAGGTLPPVR